MKALKYLPFTFVAGAHGFALFAPYLLAFMAMAQVIGPVRRRVA